MRDASQGQVWDIEKQKRLGGDDTDINGKIKQLLDCITVMQQKEIT